MTIVIKTLSTCTLEDAVTAWNQGFQDYFVQIHFTLQTFINRLDHENIDPELSFVAFENDHPIGCVLSGIRVINGHKVSWNGGTAVHPHHRRKGVARKLLAECLDVLRDRGVKILSLEAIAENTRAIRFYETLGYQIRDRLSIVESSHSTINREVEGDVYSAVFGMARDVMHLSFYNQFAPWQSQACGIKDGQSLMVKNNEEEVGYCVFKHNYNSDGKLMSITLFQCEVKPNREDQEKIMDFALKYVFLDLTEPYTRVGFNLSNHNGIVDVLKKKGYRVKMEQVYMELILN